MGVTTTYEFTNLEFMNIFDSKVSSDFSVTRPDYSPSLHMKPTSIAYAECMKLTNNMKRSKIPYVIDTLWGSENQTNVVYMKQIPMSLAQPNLILNCMNLV